MEEEKIKLEDAENMQPLPEQKFINDLAKQTSFGPMSLQQTWKKFKKSYSNEYYAQKNFESVVDRAMVEAVTVQHAVQEFFMENDPLKISQRPFRIKGKVLDEKCDEGKLIAELYVIIYDPQNPGVSMEDTLVVHTKKETKKEAVDMMNDMAKTVMQDMMKKMGRDDGQVINLLSGKPL